ncbi:oligosaccharide flippase family protein [Nitratiruptor sp. YY09-18]|uniref:oligosaccharide flippase family protein n=1 Tax=Nitratiruptor sp. YY09-18 TaxID=2724901 RepID=UPI0019156352|nr:oligosaccharide flippase family protein [Nitratiruptor sp. YY09-18]
MILAGGTAIAQAIPILISPILTRLYTPEDFGALAIFVSITSIIGVIVNGRYELAIMLPERDEDAINVAAVAFLFNIFISIIFFLFILFFGDWLLEVLNAYNLDKLLYFSPLAVFLLGVFKILNYTNNRFKRYKDISKANIYKSLMGAIVQVLMGIFKAGAEGLITGYVVSLITSNTKLFINIKYLLKHIKIEKIRKMSIKFINFPKYSLLAGLLNTIGYQIVNILIGIFYGQTTLGYYYLAIRVMGLPTSFIGNAISQVFYKQAVDEKNNKASINNSFDSTLKKLIIISVPIFTIIFFVIKPAFRIVFGENWETAGLYAMILTPMFAVNFIVKTFTLIPFIFNKNVIDLIFQFGVLIISISVFLFGAKDISSLLIVYSLLMTSYYFIYLFFLKIKVGK